MSTETEVIFAFVTVTLMTLSAEAVLLAEVTLTSTETEYVPTAASPETVKTPLSKYIPAVVLFVVQTESYSPLESFFVEPSLYEALTSADKFNFLVLPCEVVIELSPEIVTSSEVIEGFLIEIVMSLSHEAARAGVSPERVTYAMILTSLSFEIVERPLMLNVKVFCVVLLLIVSVELILSAEIPSGSPDTSTDKIYLS